MENNSEHGPEWYTVQQLFIEHLHCNLKMTEMYQRCACTYKCSTVLYNGLEQPSTLGSAGGGVAGTLEPNSTDTEKPWSLTPQWSSLSLPLPLSCMEAPELTQDLFAPTTMLVLSRKMS